MMTSIQPNKVTDDFLRFPFFYHMTHKDNLVGILQHGILSHTDVFARDDILVHDISDPSVQRWRDREEPVYHHIIHDYAPLYINPKNPMLFVRRDLQSEIVILKISSDVLEDGQHVFSDGNAASRDTQFSSNPNVVTDSVDVLNAKVWKDYVDGKRRRCAELLVYPNVHPVHILSVMCSNNALAKEISLKTDLHIEVNTSMFF